MTPRDDGPAPAPASWTVELRGWLSAEVAREVADVLARSPGLPGGVTVAVVPVREGSIGRVETIARARRQGAGPSR